MTTRVDPDIKGNKTDFSFLFYSWISPAVAGPPVRYHSGSNQLYPNKGAVEKLPQRQPDSTFDSVYYSDEISSLFAAQRFDRVHQRGFHALKTHRQPGN
ncbi:hypothetical protein SAMN05216167_1276 [Spirosoma endophyticum]|uniref:Uncharacterized protein n=1 Tax=Spirosoma endophyticum TaxID=662367 RepID=A0A1I2FPE2_9BACT|nr:hypothetical protein SAMN05216167_1276 [Spirosoma endophyticum]